MQSSSDIGSRQNSQQVSEHGSRRSSGQSVVDTASRRNSGQTTGKGKTRKHSLLPGGLGSIEDADESSVSPQRRESRDSKATKGQRRKSAARGGHLEENLDLEGSGRPEGPVLAKDEPNNLSEEEEKKTDATFVVPQPPQAGRPQPRRRLSMTVRRNTGSLPLLDSIEDEEEEDEDDDSVDQ